MQVLVSEVSLVCHVEEVCHVELADIYLQVMMSIGLILLNYELINPLISVG